MIPKVAFAAILGLVGLIAWVFISLHLTTRKQFSSIQTLLGSGGTVDQLEEIVGKPTNTWNTVEQLPDYFNKIPDFRFRPETQILEYRMEALPYWWVHVQTNLDGSKVIWYSVSER